MGRALLVFAFRLAGRIAVRSLFRGRISTAVSVLSLVLGYLAQRKGRPNQGAGLSFGLIADPQYADKEDNPRLNRNYRAATGKLRDCITVLDAAKLPFIVVLGDLIDGYDGKNRYRSLQDMAAVNAELKRFRGEKYYVLGNHDLIDLTKEEVWEASPARIKKNHYSFDKGLFHFVVLDACFRADGTEYARGNFEWTDTIVPEEQLLWLREDLAAAAPRKTLVFIHQNLHADGERHVVQNAGRVRQVLEEAGNVWAVFQGHKHAGDYAFLNGIHYYTPKALLDSPAPVTSYAIVSLDGAGSRILVNGMDGIQGGKQEGNQGNFVLPFRLTGFAAP